MGSMQGGSRARKVTVKCVSCGSREEAVHDVRVCSSCGGGLRIAHDIPLSPGQLGELTGFRRYAEWVGVGSPTHLGENVTPLSTVSIGGATVHLKNDSYLPTFSFKDRGNAFLCAALTRHDIRHVVTDSSGNAGASLAAYSAVNGIQCEVFVAAGTSRSKLQQMSIYGARTHIVEGSRESAAERAISYSSMKGLDYPKHSEHPVFIAGVETFAYEIWEQLGGQSPDAVVVPVGQGTLLLGAYEGFKRLADSGLSAGVPRFIGVQSARCCPVYQRMSPDRRVGMIPGPGLYDQADPIAEGVAIPEPFRMAEVVSAILSSDGRIAVVDDETLLNGWRCLGQQGIYLEPTGAIASGAISMLYENRTIRSQDTVVVAATGSGLKSADYLDLATRQE